MIIYLVIQQTLIGCVSLTEIELSVEIKIWEKNNFCLQGVKNIKMDVENLQIQFSFAIANFFSLCCGSFKTN